MHARLLLAGSVILLASACAPRRDTIDRDTPTQNPPATVPADTMRTQYPDSVRDSLARPSTRDTAGRSVPAPR